MKSTPFLFFFKINKKVLKWHLLNTFFYGLGAISMTFGTYYIGQTTDALINHNPNLKTYTVIMLLCVVGYELFYRFGHIVEIYLNSKIRENTKIALFKHLTTLSFGYFSDRFAGEISHKISKTADNYETMSMVMTNVFLENTIMLFSSAIMLAYIDFYYAVLVLVWGAYLVIGSILLSFEMNRRSENYATAEAKTTGLLVDTYSNISAIKVYGGNHILKEVFEQIKTETNSFRRLGVWDVLTFNFQGTSIIILAVATTLITAHLLSLNAITIGSIIFISTATVRLSTYAWEIGKNLAQFVRSYGECSQNLSDLLVEPSIKDGHIKKVVGEEIEIEYKNVSFSYEKNKPVLDNFSLHIKAGEKVGVVGLSGAGKTTFATLLLRFFDTTTGSILLNGESTKKLTQDYLRSHISYISQDTSLFHTSILKNISYGKEYATVEEIQEASALASADSFIQNLPNKYESVVGERGIKLSGGQRQRIVIARAILANRPIFLFDEATSALDSQSEKEIQNALNKLMENKTVIAIAHRLSTLQQMDRIIYMEQGKIIESGSHQELLELNGKYAQLWNMQVGGYLPDEI